MPTTKAFKSGNSQAVRIPADLAYADPAQELVITRMGNMITLLPASDSFLEAIEQLRTLPRPPTVEVYEPIEMPDRDDP